MYHGTTGGGTGSKQASQQNVCSTAGHSVRSVQLHCCTLCSVQQLRYLVSKCNAVRLYEVRTTVCL